MRDLSVSEDRVGRKPEEQASQQPREPKRIKAILLPEPGKEGKRDEQNQQARLGHRQTLLIIHSEGRAAPPNVFDLEPRAPLGALAGSYALLGGLRAEPFQRE